MDDDKKKLITAFTVLLFLAACAGKDSQTSTQNEPETSPETTVYNSNQDNAFDPEEYLLSLPDDPQTDDRIMTVRFDGIIHKELWDRFYQDSNEGKEADITICSYTVEGDPIYTWLSYDGSLFHAVTDTSRDHFGDAEMHHEERKFVIVESFTRDEEINGGKEIIQYLQAYMTDVEQRTDNGGAVAEGFTYPEDYYFLWGYSSTVQQPESVQEESIVSPKEVTLFVWSGAEQKNITSSDTSVESEQIFGNCLIRFVIRKKIQKTSG